MAPAAVLTGKWATAEDTAEALGVSARRLKQLKKLAAELLAPKKRHQPMGNGRLGSSQKRKSVAGTGTAKSKSATRVKKNTRNAHTTARAVKRSKSS